MRTRRASSIPPKKSASAGHADKAPQLPAAGTKAIAARDAEDAEAFYFPGFLRDPRGRNPDIT